MRWKSVNLPASYVVDNHVHEAEVVALNATVIELLTPYPAPAHQRRFEFNLPIERDGVWAPVRIIGSRMTGVSVVPIAQLEIPRLTIMIERVIEPAGFEGLYAQFVSDTT